MDAKITATAIEAGAFMATKVLLDYLFKTWGAVKVLLWVFAISALMCLWIAFPRIVGIVHQSAFLTPRTLLVPGVFSVLAAIFAVAWWAVWKRNPSGRAWGIIASLTYILLSLFTIWSRIHRGRSVRGSLGTALAIGVIGLFAFLRGAEQHKPDSHLA